MDELCEAIAALEARRDALKGALRINLGETAAAGYSVRCRLEDPGRLPICEAYAEQLAPEYRRFAAAVRRELSGRLPFGPGRPIRSDDLWMWGGPTPEWGGSPDPDTLMKTAGYFGAGNGVYVYGPINEEMIARHAGMKRLLAMVNNQCRAPGQQPESDPECAATLSRLSLKYPNVIGGIMDDMTSHLPTVSPEKIAHVAGVKEALCRHNPALKLYGVVYRHELGDKDFRPLQPYLDGVNLWFWRQEELLELEESVDLCRQNFPGKSILLGVFIHDYATADAATVTELLLHQLKGARQFLADGAIDGVVVMGDREILKWPEQSAAVRGFLEAQ